MESLCTSTNTKRKQNRKSKKNSFQLNPPNTIMSEKTKDFLQKICYKRAASVDMTKFGFVQDRRIYQVNMLLKPLREQLEKICGKFFCKYSYSTTDGVNFSIAKVPVGKGRAKLRD